MPSDFSRPHAAALPIAAARLRAFPASSSIGSDRVPHRRRSVRDAGDPAVAGAAHYGVTPAAMGFAVNASTMGMAVAGLVVALLSRRIDRRRGIR